MGKSLEIDDAWIGEPRSRGVSCRAAGDDFVCFSHRGDSGGGVDALAAIAAAGRDCIGRVDSDADGRSKAVLATMSGEFPLDRDAACERRRGLTKGDEEAVARMVDLLAAMLLEE